MVPHNTLTTSKQIQSLFWFGFTNGYCRYYFGNNNRSHWFVDTNSINGFRASVASPFFWYDLEKEEQTDLLLHPFCYMEANSFYEQKVSSQEALEEMLHYLNEVKKVNGTLITLWHNTFLGTDPFLA